MAESPQLLRYGYIADLLFRHHRTGRLYWPLGRGTWVSKGRWTCIPLAGQVFFPSVSVPADITRSD